MDPVQLAAVLAVAVVLASVVSVEIGLSVALVELALGVLFGNAFGLNPNADWLVFVANFASIVLTFLAGAEADHVGVLCHRHGHRVIESEIKLVFVCLFALMVVADAAHGHAVLPAFVLGLVQPLARRHGPDHATFATLLMSTGLTFGTIASLYGLNAGIIDRTRFSLLVSVVVLSAIVPTAIAQHWFAPDVQTERERHQSAHEEALAIIGAVQSRHRERNA